MCRICYSSKTVTKIRKLYQVWIQVESTQQQQQQQQQHTVYSKKSYDDGLIVKKEERAWLPYISFSIMIITNINVFITNIMNQKEEK